MGNVWDRRADESTKAFHAFTIYRDLGMSRSINKAYQTWSAQKRGMKERQLGNKKAVAAWTGWSVTHEWVKRVAAYDAWIDQQVQARIVEQRANAVIEMNERHLSMARALQGKIIQRMQTFKPEELKPFDVRSWFEVAVKIERLALGVPTDAVKSEIVGRDGEPIPTSPPPVVILLPDNGRDPELRNL